MCLSPILSIWVIGFLLKCKILILFFPISLHYYLCFCRMTLVLLLISLCAAVLPENYSQGGSIKEHVEHRSRPRKNTAHVDSFGVLLGFLSVLSAEVWRFVSQMFFFLKRTSLNIE